MLIAEQFMLVSIEPVKGVFESSRSHLDVDTLASAALLLDLAEQKRLRFNAGYVAIDTDLPAGHAQLAAASQALSGHPIRVDAAVELLVARMSPVADKMLDNLFRRDVLHRTRVSWWPGSGRRHPLRSLQARNEVIAGLREATAAHLPSLRGTGLLMLVDLAGRLPHVLDAAHHEAALQRLDALAGSHGDDTADTRLLGALRRTLLE